LYISKFKQACAIPVRFRSDGMWEFCLVRSTNKGKWVFPKGSRKKGELLPYTMLREMEEEAGLVPNVAWKDSIDQPCGAYTYKKDKKEIGVLVYSVWSIKELDRWSESKTRERKWFTYKEAMNVINRKSLRKILKAYHKYLVD